MEKGDKIKDIKNGSIHIIESIESFDDNTVIFTEDSKCLPINEVREYGFLDIIREKLFINRVKISEEKRLKNEMLKVLNYNPLNSNEDN